MTFSKQYAIKRVEPHRLLEALEEIRQNEIIAFDTETTGLRWFDREGYPSDKPFCLVVSNNVCVWVFFLKDYTNFSDKILIANIFENAKIIFAHNAKFDMHMMCNYFGSWKPPANILDTAVLANLIDNTRFKYSLDSLAKDYLGESKVDAVKEYINKHSLFTNLIVNGKPERQLHFDKVPEDLLEEYAAHDSWLTYRLGTELLKRAKSFTKPLPIDIEIKTTNVLWQMERTGISVDHKYIKQAKKELEKTVSDCRREFQDFTGFEFIDHRHTFDKIFTGAPKTEKGNSSYTDEFLSKSGNLVANIILKHRHATKKLTTYFENFEFFETTSGKIHCDFRQSGAASGRFSVVNPALQTLSKEDSAPLVRSALVPPSGFAWVSIDYNAQEFRVMLDLAARYNFQKYGSRGIPMIDEIIAGLDVHQATANRVGISRKYAKGLNFSIAYGAGRKKISEMLGITPEQGNIIIDQYYARLPEVRTFLKAVITKAEKRGYIQGPTGRMWRFKSDFAYKAPNYLIQGTCSDIMRKALIKCTDFLQTRKSKIILSIHDSIEFLIAKEEMDIIDDLKALMISSYGHAYLPLDCSYEISCISWGEMCKSPVNGIKNYPTIPRI